MMGQTSGTAAIHAGLMYSGGIAIKRLHVDGAERSGSGTIVRYAAALSALAGRELHLTNIRARRDKPGLRPQHLKAVEAVRDLCGGQLEGAVVGASEILFRPGTEIRGGNYRWDIGTGGSAVMLALTILPPAILAGAPGTFRITGGLFQDFAPSAYHLQRVLLPLLSRMGADTRLEIVRPGYVPQGGGELLLEVRPVAGGLKPLVLDVQGRVDSVGGIALSSHLAERQVGERMASAAVKVFRKAGHEARIQVVEDAYSVQPGAALAAWAVTATGCILGADQAGQPRRPAEHIGRHVARTLLADLAAGATVDRFAADQLVIFAALARGETVYRVPLFTEHLETNLWLVEKILGAGVRVESNVVRIRGVGFEAEGRTLTPDR
ncbi:MAG: RNA 3'-terminal phosphate cyclase [Bacillota bacterium]